MSSLTKAERKEKYITLAKKISSSLKKEWFVCAHINAKYYPEWKLMEPIEKVYIGSAWFSESLIGYPLFTRNNIDGNKHRVMALLLCAAMCEE